MRNPLTACLLVLFCWTTAVSQESKSGDKKQTSKQVADLVNKLISTPIHQGRLIRDKIVQKELDLLDRQVQQLTELQAKFQKRINQQLAKQATGSNLEQWKASIKQIEDQWHASVKKILLPHQIKRLKQIAIQRELKRRGVVNALVAGQLAGELELSEKQKQQLVKQAKELERELAKKIEKWREEATQELLKVLTDQQRKKLKKITGDKFDDKKSDRVRIR